MHQASLLQPEDRREASAEEDSLDSCEGDEPFGVSGVVSVDPTESPLCFLLDGGDSLDSIEQFLLLASVLDVGVDEERVHLTVDVLDSDLEAVEAAGFGDLYLAHEVFDEVFVDDSVGGCEKGEDVFDEVLFVMSEFVPVSEVPGKVYFFILFIYLILRKVLYIYVVLVLKKVNVDHTESLQRLHR